MDLHPLREREEGLYSSSVRQARDLRLQWAAAVCTRRFGLGCRRSMPLYEVVVLFKSGSNSAKQRPGSYAIASFLRSCIVDLSKRGAVRTTAPLCHKLRALHHPEHLCAATFTSLRIPARRERGRERERERGREGEREREALRPSVPPSLPDSPTPSLPHSLSGDCGRVQLEAATARLSHP